MISTIYPLRLHATLSLASWHSRPANCTGQQAMSSGPMPFFTTCMCNIERTCVERSYVQCSEMRDSRYPRVDRVLPVETHCMLCRIVLHVSSEEECTFLCVNGHTCTLLWQSVPETELSQDLSQALFSFHESQRQVNSHRCHDPYRRFATLTYVKTRPARQ